jgi:hypothetical protein
MGIKLKKENSQTLGNIQVDIFNTDLTVKKLFGSMDASVLALSYNSYTFSLPAGQKFKIQSGDRLGIKYSGGDLLNFVAITADKNNRFDGTNSYLTFYTTSWVYQ